MLVSVTPRQPMDRKILVEARSNYGKQDIYVVSDHKDFVNGLTNNNLYEYSVAMRGGIESGTSKTMTMFGVIVVVTGDSS